MFEFRRHLQSSLRNHVFLSCWQRTLTVPSVVLCSLRFSFTHPPIHTHIRGLLRFFTFQWSIAKAWRWRHGHLNFVVPLERIQYVPTPTHSYTYTDTTTDNWVVLIIVPLHIHCDSLYIQELQWEFNKGPIVGKRRQCTEGQYSVIFFVFLLLKRGKSIENNNPDLWNFARKKQNEYWNYVLKLLQQKRCWY